MNKEERALDALLALAFRTDLTNEEINELFSKPPQLSKEDEEMIRNIDIDEIMLAAELRQVAELHQDRCDC